MNEPRDVGALGRMSAELVRGALACATTGRVYDLSVELGNETPRLPVTSVAGFNLSQYRTPGSFLPFTDESGMSFSAEVVYGSLHQSTHLDALIHAQRHGRVYGGYRADELLGDFGWRKFGAETIPPVVTRGVVLDVARVVGQMPVPDGYTISVEHLQRAIQSGSVALKPGDAILIRTGKITQYASDRAAFEAGCPGLSGAAASWLADRGMMVFGLDTTSADPNPVPDWNDTAHEALLVRTSSSR